MNALFLKVIEDAELHESAKEGVISLLEKAGHDQLKIGNWRPLSLLCTDYKLFSKIISNRLSLVLGDIIHKDQSGFLKGRLIAQNLMDLNSVLMIAEKNNIEATVTSIDFEKAYDSVSWDALYKILEAFNFRPEIIKWIKICRNNIRSYIINCGRLSDPIEIKKGLRQGDPLSCGLFDIVIETWHVL